jgi:thiamine biosynthesis protein ThiS
MRITLNNREEIFDDQQMSVQELLEVKNFSFRMLVIKVNGKLIKKNDYQTTFLSDGDDVMVLHLISGG